MTKIKANIEQRFLENTASHKMQVEQDCGVYRSLLFKDPTHSYYYFRINTWPGHLCISGDMGTYVFERTEDMFSFFRMDSTDFNFSKDKILNINPGYWAEKIQSEDRHSKVCKFDPECFEREVTDALNCYCEDNDASKEDKDACLEALQQIFDPTEEYEARENVRDANWPDYDNEFQKDFANYLATDFWETDLTDYTFHYKWCLYAIVWGIKQYDEHKAALLTANQNIIEEN